jgi:hypothetical protein
VALSTPLTHIEGEIEAGSTESCILDPMDIPIMDHILTWSTGMIMLPTLVTNGSIIVVYPLISLLIYEPVALRAVQIKFFEADPTDISAPNMFSVYPSDHLSAYRASDED